jgi:hypothetical protein
MKKVLSILAVALVATFVACGPSAEEKAKLEADATRMADSLKAALEASINSAVSDAATTVDSAAAATTETTAPAEEAKH